MTILENLIRRHMTAILLLLLLGGFVMLLAELLLTGHVDGIQNVAVIASVVGAVGVAAGLFVEGTVRHVVALLLLVLTLSGLLGVRQHFESSSAEAFMSIETVTTAISVYQPIADARSTNPKPQQDEREDDERKRSDSESAPPPLAPLSLSGLALMGAVVLLAKQDELTP